MKPREPKAQRCEKWGCLKTHLSLAGTQGMCREMVGNRAEELWRAGRGGLECPSVGGGGGGRTLRQEDELGQCEGLNREGAKQGEFTRSHGCPRN